MNLILLIILAITAAFVVSFTCSLLIVKIFPRLGLMDNPRRFGYKRRPVPLPGGIAIPLVFVLVTAIFLVADKHLLGFFLGILLLTIVSFWDDLRQISPVWRLLAQFFAGIILILSGIGIEVLSNPFGPDFDLTAWEIDAIRINGDYYQLTILSDLFTIIWVIVMVNTLNWLDGVPGLSASSGAAGGITLGILSLVVAPGSVIGQEGIAIMAFIFAAVLLGFLPFNVPPIKMLLGDSGAMPIGFILGVLAIISGGKVATAFLVLALPILDAFWVGLSRFFRGQKPWEGKDKSHLHDKLMLLGWSERQILLLFFTISVFLGVSSLFLQTFGKLVLIFSLVLSFVLFRFLIERKLNIYSKNP
jgi:UDP-GlcNAc:undecaprenyl-phosphate GlcNAc-1-phosphate transferase